jgi:hypothetical protein
MCFKVPAPRQKNKVLLSKDAMILGEQYTIVQITTNVADKILISDDDEKALMGYLAN